MDGDVDERDALTRFEPVARTRSLKFGWLTLVDLWPSTGRKHQIRVHLAAIGLPIVGDKLYGPDEELFLRASDGVLTAEDERLLELPRQALHHHRIAFDHPRTGERITVESPLAPDLEEFLTAARARYA